MTSDDSNLENQPPNTPESAGSSVRSTPADGSSIGDPTRTYDGQFPHVQDPTVISEGPLVGTPDLLAGPPLQLRDIGKALVGQELGHFQLNEFVGGGGMGAVFRATDKQLARTVAVKVLTQRYGGKEDTVRRFKVEAQSAARLNHENIATVYLVGEDKGWNFIVFEFIEGENIRDLVARDGPMDIASSLSCAAQVAAALQHAAERQVVHRDIKPSNVLLAPNGRAKLVDMGLARLRQVETRDDDLTVSGVTLGTFDYISPEQGRDPRNADVRSDLYSLGCTLYYMLTGQPPYPDRTVLQKLLSHTSDPAPDPRALRPDVPADVAELTLRLLEKKPRNRYQQPTALIRDIVTAGERNGLSLGVKRPAVSAPVVAPPTALLRSLPWLLPTIVLLVSVFALDAFLSFSGGASNALPELHFEPAGAGVESSSRDEGFVDPDRAATEKSNVERTGLLADRSDVTAAKGLSESRKPIESGTTLDATPLNLDKALAGSEGGEIEYETDLRGLNGTIDGSGNDASPEPVSVVESSVDVVVAQPTEVDTLERSAESEGYQVVTTLAEALEIVTQDPTLRHIQLRTDYARIVNPIRVTSSLKISAADDFDPVLRFVPEGSPSTSDPIAMIEVESGGIEFDGIHFEFDTWSYSRPCYLFALKNAELLSISNGWVRMIDDLSEIAAYERAFVSVADGDEPATKDAPIPAIQCNNVVFGGEATVLSAPRSRPLSFEWKNGLIATSRAFAEIGGAARDAGNQIKIDLDHVTAIIDKGLCRCVASELLPHLLTVDLHVTRSILVAPESQPLIVSSGYTQDAEDLDAQIWFEGKHNFHEGTEVFWEKMQQPREGLPLLMPVRMEFEEWQRRPENDVSRSRRNKVMWQNAADPDLPRHLTKPEDFLLRDVPSNPARGAGGDRTDVGFQASKLPPAPAELR